MGRARKPLQPKLVAGGYVVRFVHPIKGKTVRIALGNGLVADARLKALNTIFLDEALWHKPPTENEFIRNEWLRHYSVSNDEKRGEPLDESEEIAGLRAKLVEARNTTTVFKEQCDRLNAEVKALRRQLNELLGRKHRSAPFPTLATALRDWIAGFTGRDPDHMRSVGWVLTAFVKHIGENKQVDWLEGREQEIEQWLRDTDVAAGTRKQYRRYVLRFLKDSDIAIDAKKISNPKRNEVRRARGKIEWLEEADAVKVGVQLDSDYWADFWRVQLMTGMRPTEMITVKAGDIAEGGMLTLSALKHLTLKNGPRTIQPPQDALAILERRLKNCDIAFPHIADERWKHVGPEISRGPWRTVNAFGKQYRDALAALEGFPIKLDARTARRTFGSIQLRKGLSVERLAKYMGTSVEVLREHYASLMPDEIKLKKIRA